VGAGALLWICSVLLIVMLAYLLIIKAVSHPGREAWARSVRSLTERPEIKPRVRASAAAPPSNRTSVIIVEDPFSEPEAVRPFLNVDLVDDDQSPQSSSPPGSRYAPSLPFPHSQSSTSIPYSSSAGSRTGTYSQPSRSRTNSHSHSHTSHSHSHTSHGRTNSSSRDRSTTVSSRTTAQSGHPLVATHSRSYSQNSLSTVSQDHQVPPVPRLPQVVLDEKRRERVPDVHLPSTSARSIPNARGPLRLQIPTAPRNEDEGTILSATSDVFSVMADFAGSPRSPRGDFHEYPPVQPLALPPDPVSRGTTPRPGPAIEMWERQGPAPAYTPPLTNGSQWSTSSSHRPLPSVSSSGTLERAHERPGYARMTSNSTVTSAASGFPFPAQRVSPPAARSGLPVTPDSYATPYASPYRPAPSSTGHTLQGDEATLFFNGRPAPPAQEEATLFFNGKPQANTEEATLFFNKAPQPPPRSQPSPGTDEATLFFNGPRATPPAPAASGDEATLFFGRPAPPSTARDEATLFFNAKPPPAQASPEATLFFSGKPLAPPAPPANDEATLFFNAPSIARPPPAAVSPEQKRATPPQPAEDEATLFFPPRR
jgi:hypothetical protein